MKIDRITYKRVKNLGNYESETLELSAVLGEDEEHSLDINIRMLKIKVQHHLGLLEDHKLENTLEDKKEEPTTSFSNEGKEFDDIPW